MKRFLFVDDNLAFAENLAEIVRDEGDEVAIAGSGALGVELARARRFDAVVTDMRMSMMSGARLVHEIRAVDPGLPAIVITAYTGQQDLEAARQEGILAILPKPVPIRRLLSLLAIARRDGLVAVVEDDPALADNLTEVLRERGFSAITAASVAATDRLGCVRPFAALVDLRMPGEPDGAALHHLLKGNPRLPVLLMSAHDEALSQMAWLQAFPKPFDSHEVLAAVEKLWR